MKHILCYGDSNTWGMNPERSGRLPYALRWTGRCQELLGSDYLIYENGVGGRTTVFDDPIEEHRCGKYELPAALLATMPLDLVVLMLGTNDTKLRFGVEAWDIAWGMDLLVQYVKKANCGTQGKPPEILIVAPAALGTAWETHIHGTVFDESSTRKSKELAAVFQKVAELQSCHFLDANCCAKTGPDCVHLTVESHQTLAVAMADAIKQILA